MGGSEGGLTRIDPVCPLPQPPPIRASWVARHVAPDDGAELPEVQWWRGTPDVYARPCRRRVRDVAVCGRCRRRGRIEPDGSRPVFGGSGASPKLLAGMGLPVRAGRSGCSPVMAPNSDGAEFPARARGLPAAPPDAFFCGLLVRDRVMVKTDSLARALAGGYFIGSSALPP